jgi:hypothetical protein
LKFTKKEGSTNQLVQKAFKREIEAELEKLILSSAFHI